ncbi:GNAT family N-acetyltransferase [Gulosibacter sediminis]|uniref:GNAT family N-acetyltransferase n=1 Tax=Gulosibacter sediminis TaxID=1729695 RepID=UPI0024ADCD94|nr:GNAT family N-acetyltransferase [Gulosibacter sediminis]
MSKADITVRPIEASDEPRWRELFPGYRAFYQQPDSEDAVSRVWSWVTDPNHEVTGLAAVAEGRVVAIAHYRRFARPSTASVGIWLDDLFTEPDIRGGGAARALITRVREIAGAEGCSVVRGITAEDNHRAQALYDQLASRTNWVTYDAAPLT